MKRSSEEGFIPFLVLAAIFMTLAVGTLVTTSIEFPKFRPLPVSSPTSSPTQTPITPATLSLPKNPTGRANPTPSPAPMVSVTPKTSVTPTPYVNQATPVSQNFNQNTNSDLLSTGLINIEFNPKANVSVSIDPLGNGSTSIVGAGDISYRLAQTGKYLVRFSNPGNLAVHLPPDTVIEVQDHKTTNLSVDLTKGQLISSFGWAP